MKMKPVYAMYAQWQHQCDDIRTTHVSPWNGRGCGYANIFRNGDGYGNGYGYGYGFEQGNGSGRGYEIVTGNGYGDGSNAHSIPTWGLSEEDVWYGYGNGNGAGTKRLI